ncbi:MAG: indole-3-glycerol-phosphate synthase [Methanomicrobiaceae archaeon]|nr:indole-3-glycerol-phosphate synthase [Methanomicrobiaceae archaeon]
MILDEILESTGARVAAMGVPPSPPYPHTPVSLSGAIRAAGDRVAVIAELKSASPSQGSIRPEMDAASIAGEFMAGGCTALSVLTEPRFFGGSTALLARVRSCAGVPILRKDFIIDMAQLDETRALGADAVLLIAGVLGDTLPAFVDRCFALGLDPLVEVHTRDEVPAALASGAEIIGINNRDLRTLKVDLRTTRNLSGMVRKEGRLVVSESGILWPYHVKALRRSADAFLIGTALMASKNPRKTLEGFVFA